MKSSRLWEAVFCPSVGGTGGIGRGRSSIEAMVRREDRVFQELARSFKLDELSQAAEVLGTLKSLLEDGNVQRVLKKAGPRTGRGGADS